MTIMISPGELKTDAGWLRDRVVNRLLLPLRWRFRHVLRRAGERASAHLIRAVATWPHLARTPRHLVVRIERLLIRCADGTPLDAADYLTRNPDVQQAGLNALDHYLAWGWAEGRDARLDLPERGLRDQFGLHGRPVSALAYHLARRGKAVTAEEPPSDLPSLEEIERRIAALRPRPAGGALVDVIIPVYRGRAETLNCLLRVLEAPNQTPVNVLVVDDCGPDRLLRAAIARMARRGLIERVVQPRNLGFVAAINAGMERHPERDVIWLNSDTEVFGDWIDRLRRVALASPDIATVTPLTNNGTIASYPRFDRDNPIRPDCGWQALDRMAASANGDDAVEAPTCVGFCTYVRRRAVDAVGMLDRATFGRGYGEENDFSCRAAGKGWRNVIAGGVFVRHIGATSFGAERTGRIDHAMRAMAKRHPTYPRQIRDFAEADPPARLRLALDTARLAECLGTNPVLMVTHNRGGGTARYVDEQVARFARQGRQTLIMTGGGAPGTVRLQVPGQEALPSFKSLEFDTARLGSLLGDLGIGDIQIQHLIELPADSADRLLWLADALDVPFDVTVHDYFAICPRINLAWLSGHYCGEKGVAACGRCLMTGRSVGTVPDITEWRQRHGRLLAEARMVRVPDEDVALRLKRYFPGLRRIVVHPHEVVSAHFREQPRRPGPLRIAVIGAIGPIKGFDVLIRLAREIRRSGQATELTVIGHTRDDATAREAGIRITGRYEEDQVGNLIRVHQPDLVFIPSTWPETFCYTLTHGLRAGCPVAAFDLGAQASRLQALGAPHATVPLTLAREPARLLRVLTEIAHQQQADQRDLARTA